MQCLVFRYKNINLLSLEIDPIYQKLKQTVHHMYHVPILGRLSVIAVFSCNTHSIFLECYIRKWMATQLQISYYITVSIVYCMYVTTYNLNCFIWLLDMPANSASQTTGILLSMLSVSIVYVSYLLCGVYNIIALWLQSVQW